MTVWMRATTRNKICRGQAHVQQSVSHRTTCGLTQILCQVDSSSWKHWNPHSRSDEFIYRMYRMTTNPQNPLRASSFLSWISSSLIPLISLVSTRLLLECLIMLPIIVVNNLRFCLCQHQEIKNELSETRAELNVTRIPTPNKVDVYIESFEASNSVPIAASYTNLINAISYTCSKGLAL